MMPTSTSLNGVATSPAPALDGAAGDWLVLANERGQYSIWPGFAEVPAGWTVNRAAASREECTAHVERMWTTLSAA